MIVLLIVAAGATYVGGWKMFEKADMPGWGILVPFYNVVLVLRMIGRPGWWLILLIIPGPNLIVAVLMDLEIAERFGKGMAFGMGLFFLPFVFLPILGYGDPRYRPVE